MEVKASRQRNLKKKEGRRKEGRKKRQNITNPH